MCRTRVGSIGGVQQTEQTPEKVSGTLMKRGRSSTVDNVPNKKEDKGISDLTDDKLNNDQEKIKVKNFNTKKFDGKFFQLLTSGTDIISSSETSSVKTKVKAEKISDKIDLTDNTTITKKPKYVPSNNDITCLTTTQDDAKQVNPPTTVNVMENSATEINGLIKDLDSAVMKGKVNKKAENFGKDFIENLDPNSKLATDVSLKSSHELKNDVSEMVFGAKAKYDTNYNKLLDKHQKKIDSINEYEKLRATIYTGNKTPEQKAELKKQCLKKLESIDPAEFKLIKADPNRSLPLGKNELRELDKNKPSLYDSLPSNKRDLVNSIVKGMETAKHPNHMESTLSLDDLKPKDREKMEGFLENAVNTKLYPTAHVTIPGQMQFKGKTYEFSKVLGGGGDGVAFLMKSGNDSIVVKSAIIDSSNTRNSISSRNEANEIFKKESQTQMSAIGQDGHSNILNLEGVVRSRGDDSLFTVTEFAKGGELTDVNKKLNTLGKSNDISSENLKLLKLTLLKDGIQGLQHIHTEKNMVHYDIKPGNFFVTEGGKSKVADFGRSDYGRDKEVPQTSDAYLPPDVREKPGEKVDIFAMGVSMYEILNGENPYANEENDPNKKVFQKDEQLTKGKTPEDSVINAMTNPKAEDRPTLTAVLQHSTFNNPIMNDTNIQGKVRELLDAVMSDNQTDITRLNQELTDLVG